MIKGQLSSFRLRAYQIHYQHESNTKILRIKTCTFISINYYKKNKNEKMPNALIIPRDCALLIGTPVGLAVAVDK